MEKRAREQCYEGKGMDLTGRLNDITPNHYQGSFLEERSRSNGHGVVGTGKTVNQTKPVGLVSHGQIRFGLVWLVRGHLSSGSVLSRCSNQFQTGLNRFIFLRTGIICF